jgi:hypothetical protein
MIQRIQSIYLLIASVILGLLFFFPIADLVSNSETYTFWYRGLYGQILGINVLIEQSTPLAILDLLILMLIISSIFLYKMRPVQMKLCLLNMILLIVSIVLTAFYLIFVYPDYNAKIHLKIFVVFPVISLLFIYLAYRGIKNDENLVKSIDRIR